MYVGEKVKFVEREKPHGVPATNEVSSTNTVKPPLVTINVANYG